MRHLWHAAVVLVVVLVARSAQADQELVGQNARGAIAVESLFGFAHQSTTVKGAFNTSVSQSQDVVTLLGGGAGAYAMPRLGLDLFVAPSITVGASAYIGLVSPNSGSSTVLQFNPRVGFLVKATRAVAIWPRVGFDFVRNSSSTSSAVFNSSAKTTLYSLTLDAPVVIAAVNQVAVVITPVLEVGLGGSTELKTGNMTLSSDQTVTQFGLMFGFLMFL